MSAEDLVSAFRKAVDMEKRWGNRTDVPGVHEAWLELVIALNHYIEEKCKKKSPK